MSLWGAHQRESGDGRDDEKGARNRRPTSDILANQACVSVPLLR